MAFYHGVPVIKVDFGNGHGGGLSFGIIILDDDYENNADGIEALNHEYGHIIHLRQVGLPVYALTTAIPSLISAGLTKIFRKYGTFISACHGSVLQITSEVLIGDIYLEQILLDRSFGLIHL